MKNHITGLGGDLATTATMQRSRVRVVGVDQPRGGGNLGGGIIIAALAGVPQDLMGGNKSLKFLGSMVRKIIMISAASARGPTPKAA